MKQILPALKLFMVLTILTGLIYPIVITGLAKLFFPQQSSGGILNRNGHTVGAFLIGQKFIQAKYFWGRPSSVDFNPLASGGSNLGPTSEALKKSVKERADQAGPGPIPKELLFASGSGLDPEISPEAALYQVSRIAKARGLKDLQKLVELIKIHEQKPDWGFIGESRVNVLKLNLALDEMGVASQ